MRFQRRYYFFRENPFDRMLTTEQVNDVDEVIRHHAPDEDQVGRITQVREATKLVIMTILKSCPPCADRSAAIRKVREAMMTANASIVLAGKSI